jgi:hypothetical protein
MYGKVQHQHQTTKTTFKTRIRHAQRATKFRNLEFLTNLRKTGRCNYYPVYNCNYQCVICFFLSKYIPRLGAKRVYYYEDS